MMDIHTDFVAVFEVNNEGANIIGIPYDPATGKIFDTITESKGLASILEQFNQFTKPAFRIIKQ